MTPDEWIEAYLERHHGKVLGRCKEACQEMAKAFPDLRIARGHVYCVWGQRGHWWLVDRDGAVVDPTASQFPGIFEYDEWEPGKEVRVGKCMECGEEIWRSVQTLDEHPGVVSFCDENCYAAFAAATMGGVS